MENKKRKILLLSDDLRLHSGIATVSRDLVLGSVHKYDWVQLGAAINHPDKGKVFDLSEDTAKLTGVPDANVKIYAHDSYGNPLVLRSLLDAEQPDAVLHFTDPRFWDWLYAMEHELRGKIPLLYLNIWDDLPDPWWNRQAYASCDLLMAISKQTYGINQRVLSRYGEPTDGRITYVPHGINSEIFKPLSPDDPAYPVFETENNKFRKDNKDRFIVFWNNRNLHRKHPGDVVLAYTEFCNMVKANGGDPSTECLLFMHTAPIDPNGTDITAVIDELCPYQVAFSTGTLSPQQMNILYNIADVTINIASNEGFGLTTAESLMAGTPIVVNVTGGLQDQCGFINPETGKYFTEDDYVTVGSLHRREEWKDVLKEKHGEWVIPVWPSNLSLQGSPPTPYIFDDRASYQESASALYEWYSMSKEERKERGLRGREFMVGESNMSRDNMCRLAIDSIESCLQTFTPRSRWEMFLV